MVLCSFHRIRKILVSVKFVSAILGPEMAAPILWAPGENAPLSADNLHAIKFLVLGGRGDFGFGGGGVPILFLWARDFSDRSHSEVCTRNRPLSETKFLLMISGGPFLSRPLCFTAEKY